MSTTSRAIKQQLRDVQQDIERAKQKAGRHDDIRLIAVSKGQSFASIVAAYEAGIRDFGENYAHEFLTKYQAAEAQGLSICWHYLGAMQSNKISLISKADFIHSVSSVRHAHLIADAVNDKRIFLQVNLNANQDRQGFLPGDLFSAIREIVLIPNLNVMGLMTILPQDHHPVGFWFERMGQLKRDIVAQGLLPTVQLSMGMSDDFIEAILHGANYIRIGTRIFGERPLLDSLL